MENLPTCFKVYLPQESSTQLKIPQDFIREFNGRIPVNSAITNTVGTSWPVSLKKVGKHWFFDNGWPEFFQQNSLNPANVLLFTYTGLQNFRAKIFAEDGCEKEPTLGNPPSG